jgi:hypothetical protein
MPAPKITLTLARAVPQRPGVDDVPATRPQPTAAARTQILKQLKLPSAGSVFATLSPARPSIADKAALVFQHAAVIDTGVGYAWWRDREVPDSKLAPLERVFIWFKADALTKRYLVDAVVNAGMPIVWGSGGTKTCAFTVRGPQVDQSFKIAEGGGHVAFIAESPTTGWHGYELTAPEPWRFTFWYCEITRL